MNHVTELQWGEEGEKIECTLNNRETSSDVRCEGGSRATLGTAAVDPQYRVRVYNTGTTGPPCVAGLI
jgi:hypothetical protein